MNCKKVKYKSTGEAERAMREINKLPQTKNPIIRTYYCEECRSFHITSKHGQEKKFDKRLTKKRYKWDNIWIVRVLGYRIAIQRRKEKPRRINQIIVNK